MSTEPATAAPGRAVPFPAATATVRRARVTTVAAALALGSVTVATILLWHPYPARDDFSYEGFASVRDAAWAGFVVDCVGYGVAGVALAIAVCLLVPGRGATLATVGAVPTAVGAMLFAAADYVFAAVGWYATEPDALSRDAGAGLMSYLGDHLGHLAGPQIVGFLLMNVGVLLLSVALWRSASVPRWLPIATAVLTLTQFFLPSALLDVGQALLMASFVAVAWFTFARRPRAAA